MDKLKMILVVSGSDKTLEELSAGARTLGERVTAAYIGGSVVAMSADEGYFFDIKGTSFVFAVPGVVKLAKELRPQLIMTEASADGRLLAGMLAAELGTSAIADCADIAVDDGKVTGRRMVYGGKAIKTETAGGETAVVCVNPGVYQADAAPCNTQARRIDAGGSDCFGFISRKEKQVQQVNLAAAKKIVGVGRGIKDEGELAQVKAFADGIGAELGCTRPVAEESRFLPRERYIGVSGCMTKPELYIAVGLSGQIQHTVGVSAAKTIIAINKDKSAPIFGQCDLGIVGDALEVLKGIEERLDK